MALCPFATVRLVPGPGAGYGTARAARGRAAPKDRIRPTQIISHTLDGALAGRTGRGHFGVGRDGEIVQWRDTGVRAAAGHRAGRRADGTGALSIDTEGRPSEPWSESQADALVRLQVWLMRRHRTIGRRVCRSAADPGLGHHALFGAPGAWAAAATSCPGPRRIEQWRQDVVPRVLAALNRTEDTMPTPEQIADAVIKQLLSAELPGLSGEDGRPRSPRELITAAVTWAQQSAERTERLERRLDDISRWLFALDGEQAKGTAPPTQESWPGQAAGSSTGAQQHPGTPLDSHHGVLDTVLDFFDRDGDEADKREER